MTHTLGTLGLILQWIERPTVEHLQTRPIMKARYKDYHTRGRSSPSQREIVSRAPLAALYLVEPCPSLMT